MNDEQQAQQYEISFVALYHFFLVFDGGCTADISEGFTSASVADRFAINDCVAAVCTISSGINEVIAHVTVSGERPSDGLDRWDHVTEFSLDIASGHLIMDDSLPSDKPITLPLQSGPYRFRVHHGNLRNIIAAYYADDRTVTEHIWITVWPEPHTDPVVLKRYPLPGARSK
jgi:hypothetical protein